MKNIYSYPVDSILLLGPTGVGKSPLGDAIGGRGLFERRCHHLDFGAELRSALSDRERSAAYSSIELDFIHGVLERSLLLENEHFPLAEKIISLFLDRVGFSQGNVLVLNGIPRHSGQAQDIATIADIHALIVLDCSAETVFCRIRDNVGGDRISRVDDNKEMIEKKMMIFRERTAPLIEHYTRAGGFIYRLEISSITTTDQAYLRLLSLTAAHPPITLIAEPPQR
ncbi:MAG TPA: nucleoside monophosphate kinase [Nitrospirota bacterium]|nr:nucleoside monophosphate kinase [Nitrospirota bacterium]